MQQNSSNTRDSLKGLLRCQTEIKNSIDYSMFFKKGFSHCKNLSVEFLETNYFRNSQGRQKMQQRLVKLLKKAKPVKSLDLHKCIVQYENIPNSTIVEIAKKTSRVRILSLPDYAVSQAVVKKYALWLKHARRLTKFDFIAPLSVDLPQLKDSEETVAKFLHEIRRDRIKSINITHKVSNTEKLENSLLAFQRYPSTLQSLNFDCRNYSDEWELSKQSVLSLSHMRDLTSLALAFRNQTDILDPMISSLDNISQLRHLKIEFLDTLNHSEQIPFEKLFGARNLNSLELKFDVWPQGLEYFLQQAEEFPLNKFCLDTTIADDDGNRQLQAIKRALSQLENLEVLKLKISKDSFGFQDKELIRDIMEQIVSMRVLKNLNIEFIIPGGGDDSEKLDEVIVPSLKTIFLKAQKLQNFSIHCNQIQNSRQAFMSILASLARGRNVMNLKKLKVDVGKFMPEESELRQISNFTERFLNIETLKLMSICGLMSQSLQGFLETVENLKYLKKFEVSELQGSLNKKIFVSVIEKLLSKRGFEKFDCCLTWDTKETGARRVKGCQIDLKKVLEKNPSLQNYPQSSIIFSYYNDDTAWKWS